MGGLGEEGGGRGAVGKIRRGHHSAPARKHGGAGRRRVLACFNSLVIILFLWLVDSSISFIDTKSSIYVTPQFPDLMSIFFNSS